MYHIKSSCDSVSLFPNLFCCFVCCTKIQLSEPDLSSHSASLLFLFISFFQLQLSKQEILTFGFLDLQPTNVFCLFVCSRVGSLHCLKKCISICRVPLGTNGTRVHLSEPKLSSHSASFLFLFISFFQLQLSKQAILSIGLLDLQPTNVKG